MLLLHRRLLAGVATWRFHVDMRAVANGVKFWLVCGLRKGLVAFEAYAHQKLLASDCCAVVEEYTHHKLRYRARWLLRHWQYDRQRQQRESAEKQRLQRVGRIGLLHWRNLELGKAVDELRNALRSSVKSASHERFTSLKKTLTDVDALGDELGCMPETELETRAKSKVKMVHKPVAQGRWRTQDPR